MATAAWLEVASAAEEEWEGRGLPTRTLDRTVNSKFLGLAPIHAERFN